MATNVLGQDFSNRNDAGMQLRGVLGTVDAARRFGCQRVEYLLPSIAGRRQGTVIHRR